MSVGDDQGAAQERLSTYIIEAEGKAAGKPGDGILRWPNLSARLIGDAIRDPRAPDVRSGRPLDRRPPVERMAA